MLDGVIVAICWPAVVLFVLFFPRALLFPSFRPTDFFFYFFFLVLFFLCGT